MSSTDESTVGTTPYKNTGLFADYFLTEKLPGENVWREALADPKARETFEALRGLYAAKKKLLPGSNEAQTENEFIRPVLDVLGFAYIVQVPTRSMGRGLVPDYALFANESAKDTGHAEVQANNYSSALAVADAKYWERPLDKRIKDARDELTNQNPTFQISSYLVATKANWAILTNGRHWRLYSRDHSQTMGEYYEVDLPNVLEAEDSEAWLYFYLFFRKEAFEKLPDVSFLDQVIKESIDYGAGLQESLKALIFEKIFKHLAEGFVSWRRANAAAAETPESLRECFNSTLILLYRLLFILYAESRDLLPVGDAARYHSKSLAKIKEEIKQDVERGKALSGLSTDYWDDLANLFRIIDRGDPALNVPKYNGGLFSAERHSFIEENKIADEHLVEAIYLLTTHYDDDRKTQVFVDYKSLGVKQLGSIYEGLLEFHLSVAGEELAVVKEKGKEKYVPIGEIAGAQRDTGARVRQGELYLENTKAERKATGSYYTPDYIVKYIVENTVGPLIDDIERQFDAKVEELKSDYRYKGESAKWKTLELGRYDPALKALELKVCDPAMGSGHFLVTTVDYIATRIYDILSKQAPDGYFGKEPYESPLFEQIDAIRQNILTEMTRQQVTIDHEKLEDDKVMIRRMVMKRCVFGVDLNYLAVELAKLSLWLNSFTVGAPLSFLDHHLRWGNSLIGATVSEVEKEIAGAEQVSLFGSRFAGLISATDAMIHVGELTDSTFSELEESRQDYDQALGLLGPYKRLLDIYTSQYFGNSPAKWLLEQGKIDPDNFTASVAALSDDEQQTFSRAVETRNEKRFFHWELEFPEVFYKATGKKENPGFDAVVGNPPYGSSLDADFKLYMRGQFQAAGSVVDVFTGFLEKGVGLTRVLGRIGQIIPSGWLTSGEHLPVRTVVLATTQPSFIVHLPYDVFSDAYIDCIIFVARREEPPADAPVRVKRFGVREQAAKILNNFSDYAQCDSSIWRADSGKLLVTDTGPGQWLGAWHAKPLFVSMGEALTVSRGITPFVRHERGDQRQSAIGFRGSVARYALDQQELVPVVYDPSLAEFRPREFFTGPRLVIRRIISRQHRIHATYTSKDFVVNKSYLPATQKIGAMDLRYCLTLLNSLLFARAFVARSEVA